MTYFAYAEKLNTLKYLAERRQTGLPNHLAQKLNVSERTVQRMVQQLREHGYPITFNRIRGTYEINND